MPPLKSVPKRAGSSDAAVRSPPQSAALSSAPLAADVRELLGPAWIIKGENPKRYEQLLARIVEAVGPMDFINLLLVKDVAALTWEIQRSRRQRATLVRMGRLKALEQILAQALPRDEFGVLDRAAAATDFAAGWLNGDRFSAQRVGELLKGSGFSPADVETHAMTVMALELENIDLQVQRHEVRPRFAAAPNRTPKSRFCELDPAGKRRRH